MIARALREMDERLRAEKTIKPKAREKMKSGVTLEKTPRLMSGKKEHTYSVYKDDDP